MHISRVVIRNFRSFKCFDVLLPETTCVISANNTEKINFLHAIKICIDASLSSTDHSLIPNDIHSTVNISHPNQVLIGLEITDFEGKINENELVGAWKFKPGLARLIYRYRPKLGVREDLGTGKIKPGNLTRSHYDWEITGGGDPNFDLVGIEWDEDVGSSIRFSGLQSFVVVFLAPYDVESALRQFRSSPLAGSIYAMKIDPGEQEKFVDSLRKANGETATASMIGDVAKAIINAPFLEYFYQRFVQDKLAGQIILFEEPGSYLHQMRFRKAGQGVKLHYMIEMRSCK